MPALQHDAKLLPACKAHNLCQIFLPFRSAFDFVGPPPCHDILGGLRAVLAVGDELSPHTSSSSFPFFEGLEAFLFLHIIHSELIFIVVF